MTVCKLPDQLLQVEAVVPLPQDVKSSDIYLDPSTGFAYEGRGARGFRTGWEQGFMQGLGLSGYRDKAGVAVLDMTVDGKAVGADAALIKDLKEYKFAGPDGDKTTAAIKVKALMRVFTTGGLVYWKGGQDKFRRAHKGLKVTLAARKKQGNKIYKRIGNSMYHRIGRSYELKNANPFGYWKKRCRTPPRPYITKILWDVPMPAPIKKPQVPGPKPPPYPPVMGCISKEHCASAQALNLFAQEIAAPDFKHLVKHGFGFDKVKHKGTRSQGAMETKGHSWQTRDVWKRGFVKFPLPDAPDYFVGRGPPHDHQ